VMVMLLVLVILIMMVWWDRDGDAAGNNGTDNDGCDGDA